MTPSCQPSWRNCLSFMCFQSMAFRIMSRLTEDPSLSCISLDPSGRYSMCQHFTSGYHQEGNGQTEHMNQTLEQYIHVYCNYQQDNWDLLLPRAEFAYKNALSTTTGISPFFANKGYHPNITVHPEWDFASIRACKFAVDLDELHSTLKDHIREAQS